MKMKQEVLDQIKSQIKRVKAAGGFYAERLRDVDIDSIRTREDFEQLPFSEKDDLREA